LSGELSFVGGISHFIRVIISLVSFHVNIATSIFIACLASVREGAWWLGLVGVSDNLLDLFWHHSHPFIFALRGDLSEINIAGVEDNRLLAVHFLAVIHLILV